MRRNSLVLAWVLLGSLAATGCTSKGTPPSTRTGLARGVAGKSFYVNLFTSPVGGIVKSGEATPRISCGASAVTVVGGQYAYTPYADGAACGQTLYQWTSDGKALAADGSNLTKVLLKAVPQGTNAFLGWAGDCSGLGDCTLTAGADKSVVALFGVPGTGHPNLMDPALHGPLFLGHVAGNNALDCAACHGTTFAGRGIAPSCNDCHAAAGVPSWQTTCNFCHQAPPDDGVHPPVTPAYPGNITRCVGCHAETVDATGHLIVGGKHMNGHVEASGHPAGFSDPAVHSAVANADIIACTACHGADYAGQGSIPSCNACHLAAGWSDWRTNCSFCHGLKNATTQAGYDFAAHPDWAAPPADLIGRRTGTNGPATGAHQAHVAANLTRSPIPCSECHTVPTSATQQHHGLQLPFGPISKLGGAVPTWDPATLTCSSTYCHGTFSYGAVQGNAGSPAWGGHLSGCTTCHAMPPAGHIPVGSTAATCSGCHPDTVLPTGAIDLAKGRHVNGQKDVSGGACDSCHWFPYPSAVPPAVPWAATGAHLAHYGLTAGQGSTGYGDLDTLQVKFPVNPPTTTGYAFGCGNCHPIDVGQHSMLSGGSTAKVVLYEAAAPATSLKAKNAATAAFFSTTKTCSGVYCHGNVAATPAWTGGTLACNGCHGTSTPNGLPDYASGSPKANSHAAHNYACSTCHLATTASAGTIASSSRHVNGGLDVTAGPGVTFTYNSAATGGTCSNVSCHGGGSATWGPVGSHLAALGTGDIQVFTPDSTHDVTPLSITESCTICHAPSLITQHANRCDLCHQGSNPAAALIGTWSKSCTASGCHAAVHASGPATNHDGMYWNSSASCSLCHDSSGGDFPGPGDNCTRCHDPSYTAAAVGDHQAPTTTSNAVASYVGSASIHLTATDAGTSGVSVTWLSLNGGRWTLGTDVSASAPVTGSRAYSLQFYSVDHARNAEAVKSVGFTVSAVPDTTPPVTSSSFAPAAGAIFKTTQSVTLSATDNASGVKATYYRIDAAAFAQATSFTVTDGLHTFSWYSLDNANNTETTHASNQFRVDTIAPVTTGTAVNGFAYTGNQTFTLSPTDGGSGVASTWYRLDGGALTAGLSIPVAAPASGSASHTLTWYSIDVATNQEATRTATFTVQAVVADTTPPVTTSSFNPAAGAVFKAAQAVTLSASDTGSGVKTTYWRTDSGSYAAGTSFSVSADGVHAFSYYSVDNANNTETAHTSNSFRIDTVAPVTTSTAVTGQAYTGAQSFTLGPTDAGSGVASTSWRLDGGAWTSGTSVAVAAPASGSASHTLDWYSTDVATNVEATHSVTFTVAAATSSHGSVTFTASGAFTIPAGVTSLTIDALGGGGEAGIEIPSGTGATGGTATVTYGSLSINANGGTGGGNSASSSRVGLGGSGGQALCAGALCSSLTRTNGTGGQDGGWYPDPDSTWGLGGLGGAPNGASAIDPPDEFVGGAGGGGGGGEITGTIPVTPGSTVTIAIGTGSTVSFTW